MYVFNLNAFSVNKLVTAYLPLYIVKTWYIIVEYPSMVAKQGVKDENVKIHLSNFVLLSSFRYVSLLMLMLLNAFLGHFYFNK